MNAGQGKKKVIVIGGGGFLGSRAVQALRGVDGIDVVVASRSREPRVDLADDATFDVLRDAELVIDLADATTSAPDRLAAWCLEQGVTLLETTSDFSAIERLAKLADRADPKGRVILGAGIFTGLSNLMASDVAALVGKPESVTLAIRSSPYSGAGTGTVALMAAMLSVDAASIREGRRVTLPPVSRGPVVHYASGEAPSLRIPLAEVLMMQRSIGAPAIDGYFSPKPSLLVLAFLALPAFLLRSSLFAAFMRWYFGLLRRFVLRGVTTTTELHTHAEGANGMKQSLDLSAPDGMTVGGVAIAAIAAELLDGRAIKKGVSMIDELVALEPVLARMRTLAGENVVTLRRSS